MNDLKATILLEDVYVDDYHDLLEIINKIDDNVKLQFKIPVANIVDLVKEYLKVYSDHLSNIDEYDCILPEVINKYRDGVYFFCLNSSDDDEDQSDVTFIKEELKRQFGANFNKDVPINEILKILLIGSEYDIIDNILVVNMYYKTYNVSWLKDIIGNYSC